MRRYPPGQLTMDGDQMRSKRGTECEDDINMSMCHGCSCSYGVLNSQLTANHHTMHSQQGSSSQQIWSNSAAWYCPPARFLPHVYSVASPGLMMTLRASQLRGCLQFECSLPLASLKGEVEL